MQFDMAYAFLCIQRASCCIANISIRAAFGHFQLTEPNVVTLHSVSITNSPIEGLSIGVGMKSVNMASIPGELDGLKF